MAGSAKEFLRKRNPEMYSDFLRLITTEMNGVEVDDWEGKDYYKLSTYTDDLSEACKQVMYDEEDGRYFEQIKDEIQKAIDHFESFFEFMGKKDGNGKSNYAKMISALSEDKQIRFKKYLLAANIDMGINYDLDSLDPSIRAIGKEEEKNEAPEEENVAPEKEDAAAEHPGLPDDWDELSVDELSEKDKNDITSKAEAEQYDLYVRLVKEKNYKEIAKIMIDVQLQSAKDPENMVISGKVDGQIKFLDKFRERRNVEGYLSESRYDDLLKLWTTFAEIQVEEKVKFVKAVTEYADKIMNGEIPELEKFKGSRTAALDIAGSYIHFSEYGRRAEAASQILGTFQMGLEVNDPFTNIGAGLIVANDFTVIRDKVASLSQKDVDLFNMYTALKYDKANDYGLDIERDFQANVPKIKPKADAKNVKNPKIYHSAEEVKAEIKGIQDKFNKTKKLYDLTMNTWNWLSDASGKLIKTVKSGHQDGNEFETLEMSIGNLFAIQPETDLECCMMKPKLSRIRDNAQSYINTHSKWYQNNFGYGAERLKIAKDIVKKANETLEQFEDAYKESGLKERDSVAMDHIKAKHELAFMQEIKKDFPELKMEEPERKKLEGDDLKNFLNDDKKAKIKNTKKTVSIGTKATDLEAPRVDIHTK